MTRTIPILFALSVLCCVLLVAIPADARAEGSAPKAREITVEIASGKKAAPDRVAFTVATDEGSTAEASSLVGSDRFRVKAFQRTDRGLVLVQLDLELERSSASKVVDVLSLKAAARLAVGKRAVLGRVEQSDGTSHEIAVTVR